MSPLDNEAGRYVVGADSRPVTRRIYQEVMRRFNEGQGVTEIRRELRQMAKNADSSPDIVLSTILSESFEYGWDFASDSLSHLVEEGIIDPVKVTICALQNGASVATALITSNHAIVET